jgi:membrane-associated phospholipid phosphatase
MTDTLNIKQFKVAALLTLSTAIIILLFNYYWGKVPFFLLLNTNLGVVADYTFFIFTLLGDGVFWLALLFVFIKFKKRFIPLLISTFLISTLLVQGCKNFILPHQPRPYSAIENKSIIHTVSFVQPHAKASFPSGHTTAAFCYFYLLILVYKRKYLFVLLFIYALMVGYSRVYLAQHFPLDVAVGMLVATVSVIMAVYVQNYYLKRTFNE